jgi:hypothetical protein
MEKRSGAILAKEILDAYKQNPNYLTCLDQDELHVGRRAVIQQLPKQKEKNTKADYAALSESLKH